MATIITGLDINDYMDNLVAELKDFNAASNANGGANYAFGAAGSERIYGYLPDHLSAADDIIPNTAEPVIICSFTGGGEGHIQMRTAAWASSQSGRKHLYLAQFSAEIRMVWACEARSVLIPEARAQASRLWVWLDTHNIKGFCDYVRLSRIPVPLIPEAEMVSMGRAGYKIDHYGERDVIRNLVFVDQT